MGFFRGSRRQRENLPSNLPIGPMCPLDDIRVVKDPVRSRLSATVVDCADRGDTQGAGDALDILDWLQDVLRPIAAEQAATS